MLNVFVLLKLVQNLYIYIFFFWDVFLTIIATSTLQLDGAGDDVVKFILTGN